MTAASPTVHEGSFEGHASVTLTADPYSVTFLPGVGMLGASITHQGREFVSLHGGVAAYEAGHTTGIPLLHPWANRLSGFAYRSGGVDVSFEDALPVHSMQGLPIHGTLTAQHGWEHAAVVDDQEAVLRATFDFGARPDLLSSFPFPHLLEIVAAATSDGVRVTTVVRPTGDRAVPVSFGWHPYFVLPDAARHDLAVVLPAREHLELDDAMLPTGRSTHEESAVFFLGDDDHVTFDDAYRLDGDRFLSVQGAGVQLTISYSEEYPYAQVFAPVGKPFVALEPMTAPINALVTGNHPVVEPGDEFHATFTVFVDA